MLSPLLIPLLLVRQGPAATGAPIGVIFSSEATPGERERLLKDPRRFLKRDDGASVWVKESEGSLYVIETSLLPDRSTEERLRAIRALKGVWKPGEALTLRGSARAALAGALFPQVGPPVAKELRAAGGCILYRSAMITLESAGRRGDLVLDDDPHLPDDVYPAGTDDQSGLPPIPPAPARKPMRFATVLGLVGSASEARILAGGFALVAGRWKADTDKLLQEGEELSRLLDEDLAKRNPYGDPKAGTTFDGLSPKLQGYLREQFAGNWKAHGFSSEAEATAWLGTATITNSRKQEFCGFGAWDQGRGGRFIGFSLFRP